VVADKEQVRRELLAGRRAMPPAARRAAGEAIAAALLAVPEIKRAGTVAAYVGVGTEPSTAGLLQELSDRGTRVLLPVLLPDNDLDWACYTSVEALVEVGRGLLEPPGSRLGPDAVREADVVLCPGLAVGADGTRLGRGGGSYDRVLSRVAPDGTPRGPWTCVLLYDTELLADVPADAHDRRIDAAVTPSRLVRFA